MSEYFEVDAAVKPVDDALPAHGSTFARLACAAKRESSTEGSDIFVSVGFGCREAHVAQLYAWWF